MICVPCPAILSRTEPTAALEARRKGMGVRCEIQDEGTIKEMTEKG
jgi:hypothetical protein